MQETRHYENQELWRSDLFNEKSQQARFKACAELIPKKATSVLDVGCGNGAFLLLLEGLGSSLRTQGLERSIAAIQAAVCKSPIDHGTIDNMPFSFGEFDLVSALEVIEHLPYGIYEKALVELARVAKNNILISIPYKEKRVYVKCPYCACKFNSNYHMRSFDDTSLSSLFSQFQLVDTVKVNVDDYLLAPFLRKAYQILTKNKIFPPHALCPQCGFAGSSVENKTLNSTALRTRNRLREVMKERIPKYKRVNWIVALYERIG